MDGGVDCRTWSKHFDWEWDNEVHLVHGHMGTSLATARMDKHEMAILFKCKKVNNALYPGVEFPHEKPKPLEKSEEHCKRCEIHS